jgi:hypothetical protein
MNFPYVTNAHTTLESTKSNEGLDEKKVQQRKDLLELDIMMNPTSHQTYMIYGFLNSFTFIKSSEFSYTKGQKTTSIHKEFSDFDTMLNCFSNTLYIILSKFAYKFNLEDQVTEDFKIKLISKKWFERGEQLKRWPDSNLFFY